MRRWRERSQHLSIYRSIYLSLRFACHLCLSVTNTTLPYLFWNSAAWLKQCNHQSNQTTSGGCPQTTRKRFVRCFGAKQTLRRNYCDTLEHQNPITPLFSARPRTWFFHVPVLCLSFYSTLHPSSCYYYCLLRHGFYFLETFSVMATAQTKTRVARVEPSQQTHTCGMVLIETRGRISIAYYCWHYRCHSFIVTHSTSVFFARDLSVFESTGATGFFEFNTTTK